MAQRKGLILQLNGITKLVGFPLTSKTGNKILDTFIGLPNEALEESNCKIK